MVVVVVVVWVDVEVNGDLDGEWLDGVGDRDGEGNGQKWLYLCTVLYHDFGNTVIGDS